MKQPCLCCRRGGLYGGSVTDKKVALLRGAASAGGAKSGVEDALALL